MRWILRIALLAFFIDLFRSLARFLIHAIVVLIAVVFVLVWFAGQ